MSRYETLYVEGSDDRLTMDWVFDIAGLLEVAGDRRRVLRNVEKNPKSCGLVDRDFCIDQDIEGSRREGSRCVILQRYSLENYLLEPTYLFEFAKQYGLTEHQDWTSEATIVQLLIRKGRELCHYAAANEMLYQFAQKIAFYELTPYFNDYPVYQQDDVRTELVKRFTNLPTREILDTKIAEWEKRSVELQNCCQSLEEVNRWINGKILLRDVIYDEVIHANPEYSRTSKKGFVKEIAYIAKDNPPQELVDILRGFGIAII